MVKANSDSDYVKVMSEWFKERKLGIKEAMASAAHYRKVADISLQMADSSEEQAGYQVTLANIEMAEYNKWRKEKGMKPLKMIERPKKGKK